MLSLFLESYPHNGHWCVHRGPYASVQKAGNIWIADRSLLCPHGAVWRWWVVVLLPLGLHYRSMKGEHADSQQQIISVSSSSLCSPAAASAAAWVHSYSSMQHSCSSHTVSHAVSSTRSELFFTQNLSPQQREQYCSTFFMKHVVRLSVVLLGVFAKVALTGFRFSWLLQLDFAKTSLTHFNTANQQSGLPHRAANRCHVIHLNENKCLSAACFSCIAVLWNNPTCAALVKRKLWVI